MLERKTLHPVLDEYHASAPNQITTIGENHILIIINMQYISMNWQPWPCQPEVYVSYNIIGGEKKQKKRNWSHWRKKKIVYIAICTVNVCLVGVQQLWGWHSQYYSIILNQRLPNEWCAAGIAGPWRALLYPLEHRVDSYAQSRQ